MIRMKSIKTILPKLFLILLLPFVLLLAIIVDCLGIKLAEG